MSKFLRFLSVLLLILALSPAVFADDDQPIRIKSAVIETEDSRVAGEVTICNTERERIRFVLDVKNLTINKIYKRKLAINASDCITTELDFTEDFAEMSNVGDEIEMVAKHSRGLWSHLKYRFSKVYTTEVVKGDRDYAGCGDKVVEDGIFGACVMDFLNHTPSGLRIKVVENKFDYVRLKLTHIEWGGTKEMRIWKGRTKKIRSNYDELKRVEITNVYGDGGRDLNIQLETLY